MSSDLEKYRGLGPKTRMMALGVVGVLAILYAAHVWTTDDPPDLGGIVPCGGVTFLVGLYFFSLVDLMQAQAKAEREKGKDEPR